MDVKRLFERLPRVWLVRLAILLSLVWICHASLAEHIRYGSYPLIFNDDSRQYTWLFVIDKQEHIIEWDASQAEKGEYPFFMLKEVMEQREVLPRAVNQSREDIEKAAEMVRSAGKVFAVGCGTAAQKGSHPAFQKTLPSVPRSRRRRP